MKEKNKELKNTEKSNKKIKMTFAIVILAALFIVELYLMINAQDSYLPLACIGLVMLCAVYYIIDLTFKIQNEKNLQAENRYEKLYKSGKVTYVLMKKSLMELTQSLEELKLDTDFPLDELIQAQKATAKVTINRSKENATAIMNSNDKVLDQMLQFNQQIKEIAANVEESQNNSENSNFSEYSENIIAKQQEMLSSIQKLEANIKEEIAKQMEMLNRKIENIEIAAPSPVQKEAVIPEMAVAEEPVTEEIVIPEMPEMPEMPVVEETIVEELEAEDVVTPEMAVAEEPVAEETVINESIMTESDPNHIMTPEEIAAMLGEVDALIEESEPEPVVEEKAPMPDLSDPGHVMTPEEIADLLANM